MENQTAVTPGSPSASPWNRLKLVVGLLVLGVLLALGFWLRKYISLSALVDQAAHWERWRDESPVLVYSVAFLIYVVVTGLSLPGAAAMTLVYGWFFGLVGSVILVSFASTLGATIAFLLSRYLFRDAVTQRFGSRLEPFQKALEREGAFYLFSLRLIPAIPFFVINLVMGLTKLPTRTFWWVSQLGMLPGTVVYAFAGASVPSAQKLAQEGFRPSPQILLALVALGLFPWLVKSLLGRRTNPPPPASPAE